MKEELKGPKVENIAVAVVQELGENNAMIHNVYLINEKKETLENVLVTSKGYAFSAKTNEKLETNILRKLLGDIKANSVQMIEPIMEDVLGLNNEYWVSFWVGTKMYDKKYIFLSETIKEENFINIPILNKKGVLLR